MLKPSFAFLPRFVAFNLTMAVFWGALMIASPSDAKPWKEDPYAAPSIFSYTVPAMGVGAGVGLSATYLIARNDADWRSYVIGGGAGALAGAVAGLGVGLLDISDGQLGMGAIVVRDTWYGALLGATAGLIAGTISWAVNGELEHLGVGSAWGTVIGAPVGAVVGVIEGSLFERQVRRHYRRPRDVEIRVSVQRLDRGDGVAVGWVPTVAGSF